MHDIRARSSSEIISVLSIDFIVFPKAEWNIMTTIALNMHVRLHSGSEVML